MTKTFNFDRVFGTKSAQQDVYKAVVGPLIKQVLAGNKKKLISTLKLKSFTESKRKWTTILV